MNDATNDAPLIALHDIRKQYPAVRDHEVDRWDDDTGHIGIMAMTNFLQDRPILENQVPLRLPLAPGAELSMRADRMSEAYRRYLSRRKLRYGFIAG